MLEINHDIFTKCQDDLNNHGHTTIYFEPAFKLKPLVQAKNYPALDDQINTLTQPKRELFQTLSRFEQFSQIEFILSLREACNEWEEDGIWHDDGSRKLAFSLSLTLTQPTGGELGFRHKKTKKEEFIKTPPFAHLIIFKTGISGYEHKIHAVTQGARLVAAGWCS